MKFALARFVLNSRFALDSRSVFIAAAATVLSGAVGCGPGASDTSSETPFSASAGPASESDVPETPELPATTIETDRSPAGQSVPGSASRPPASSQAAAPDGSAEPAELETVPDFAQLQAIREVVTGIEAEQAQRPRKLDNAMSIGQLAAYLQQANDDLQTLITGGSGITDPDRLVKTINDILDAKLQASQLLVAHADASPSQKITGLRSQIQTLSHLASNGSVTAAEQLEELATELQSHPNMQVSLDSSLVLIGFRVEKVRQGKDGAEAQLMSAIEDFIGREHPEDIAALMVLGNAREALSQSGSAEQAARVRKWIVERFAASSNEQVAQLANRIIGSAEGERFDLLLRRVIKGDSVPVDQFVTEAQSLASSARDITTVQYLGGAAVELEGYGRDAHADAVYALLATEFDDSPALSRTAEIAIQARKNRREIIGKTFDPDFDGIDGSELSLANFRGKVILVPFWSANYPESLQMIPVLREIAEADPRVAVVGVNMDAAEPSQIQQFADENKLVFPSFHTVDAANMQAVGTRFGIASMPFTAILTPGGKVGAVNFTGVGIDEVVADLLSE